MNTETHEHYMQRCLQLATLASGDVAPNPMVGAVLVHEGMIIGEGYHRTYGQAHAEVACFASVPEAQQHLISKSTLYVSLEPCAHFGKTPPCADLVIRQNVPRVVVGCRDPFPEVAGKGIEKLKAAGVDVTVGVLEKECRELNKRFFLFHTGHRPFIVLKWAQTADGKIAGGAGEFFSGKSTRLQISNEYTARVVHKWRSEEMAIAIGTNTALVDDPALSTRHWPGPNPVRIVVDRNLRLPSSLRLFNDGGTTLVFNLHRHSLPFEKIGPAQLRDVGVAYYQITNDVSVVHQVLNGLYQVGIQSVLVEGGTQLLQSFIDENLWDEARIITNETLAIGDGLPAPQLKGGQFLRSETFSSDTIRFYERR